MKPVIDRTFPFDQVKQAFSYMASGAHFGVNPSIPLGPCNS
jgi:hypothetical protein